VIERIHVGAIVIVAVTTMLVALYLSGEAVSWTWLKSIGASVAATYGATQVFNRFLWRVRLLQGWFVKRPHLWGDWDVTITSLWADPVYKSRPEPIEATFSIKQTYASVHMRMKSKESKGELLSAGIVANGDGSYRLVGTFRNEPDLSIRGRSQIHHGALMLDIEGPPNEPHRLRGHYWTDRETMGEIEARRRA
jgi:SMODS-associating 2TM, beta-strand rich effector domain